MRILVTGGAGFIGSGFVRFVIEQSRDVRVLNLDLLTYAGNLENLAPIDGSERYEFVQGDIADPVLVDRLLDRGFDAIVNFAAESHVDRSILDSGTFLKTNVQGTQVLLEAARKHRISRFLQVSTDEVYGSLGDEGRFTEASSIEPNSPYAASKAAADLFVRAYHHTHGLETVISRCCNNYGPYQFPEKLIPLMILNALENRPLPVYGDGLYVRDWIHVDDHSSALWAVLQRGRSGAVYNIGADQERQNIEVIHQILESLGCSRDLIKYVQDRPGHDRRYAIDASLLKEELGWHPSVAFEDGLLATIQWYKDNPDWLEHVRSGEYMSYYRRMYDQRDDTLSDLC